MTNAFHEIPFLLYYAINLVILITFTHYYGSIFAYKFLNPLESRLIFAGYIKIKDQRKLLKNFELITE